MQKIRVSRPSQLGKFANFRVIRVKISFRKAHQKRFFYQNGVQGCNGWGSRRGGAERGFYGNMLRQSIRNHNGNTKMPDNLRRSIKKGF